MARSHQICYTGLVTHTSHRRHDRDSDLNHDGLQHKHSKHGGHALAVGLELGAWLPIAAVIFLTAGTVAVFALVTTGLSPRQLALASPYDCSFATNGAVGCDETVCSQCLNGSSVAISSSLCSCESPVVNTPIPPPPTSPPPSIAPPNTPVPGAPTVAPIPTISLAAGGGGTVVVPIVSKTQATTTTTKTTTGVKSTVTTAPVKTYSFGNLPLESALKIFSGKANGSQCTHNKDCESKLCVATDDGNYCGDLESQCQSNQLRCTTKNGGNVVQQCNINGYWQMKTICSGGCQKGACITTLCTPNQASCEQNNRKICSSDGMSWKTENCSSSTVCKDGACTIDSIPTCSTSSSCNTAGSYCTNSEQQKFICVNGGWQQLFNGQKVSVVGCNVQKAGLYLAGLNDAVDLISGINNLVIDCSTQASIFNLSAASLANACQLDTTTKSGFVRFLCNSGSSINTIAHSARHEAAKVWAMQHGFSGAVVPGYSEAVGCRRQNSSVGVLYVFGKEQPVSALGRKDCSEAFAEAVAMYLEEPCRMKEIFPIQYRWMSSLESLFKGVERCAR